MMLTEEAVHMPLPLDDSRPSSGTVSLGQAREPNDQKWRFMVGKHRRCDESNQQDPNLLSESRIGSHKLIGG